MGKHRTAGRAGRRPASDPNASPGGHRKAAPTRGPRFPVAPTVLGAGALALVLVTVGALSLSSEAPAAATPPVAMAGAVSALDGTDTNGFTSLFGTDADASGVDEALLQERGQRQAALSRDSQRRARSDAADQKLQVAAEQQMRQRNTALASLARSAEARASEIARDQWQLPAAGYRLTARFGMTGGLWSSNHTGLDFAAPTGTPLVAIASGVVTEVGSAGSYGQRTIITLDDGTEMWFCHQSATVVTTGQTVTAGQQIGAVGSTGNVTGPHLHLEIRPGGGDPVDPFSALSSHGLQP